ncbi:MAG: type I-U CRISPR-associated protein Cas7 [Acidobacteria bacterium]|nr:type I-U CRISPR-associated protein Cas7 [Acidobacteriota bacterium]
MKIDRLNQMVVEDAALRRRQTLQPMGGKGDKIFPPTYPGEGRNAPPRHVYERRRVNGQDVWCVLVDSVQSQANRLEESLLGAVRDGVSVPYVVVDFTGTGLEGITAVTSLDAPHRVYDAILRDSLLNDEPFMNSVAGKRLAKAKPEDASSLLEISPTALLFGAWHSTGEGGGLGAKFARCLTSEIMAIDVPVEFQDAGRGGRYLIRTADRLTTFDPVTAAWRPGSRIDPLGISRQVEIFRSAKDASDWTAFEKNAAKEKDGTAILYTRKKGDKAGKPAVINHGNIKPSLQPLGITCDRLEHSFVLSFAALRRLRFGDPARDVAARSFLAALGLVALVEQDARGYALRSRCDLVCDGRLPLEVVHPDGAVESIALDREAARNLYKSALEAMKKVGFDLSAEPLRLTPQDKLVEIVRKSQDLALAGKGEEAEKDEAAER